MWYLQHGFDMSSIVGNTFYVLLILIGFDIVTGLLASAKEHKINSNISFDGLIRKTGEIIALFFLTFIDAYFDSEGYIVKVGVGMMLIYEGLSIIENFARIGVDIKFLTKWFDKNKTGKGE